MEINVLKIFVTDENSIMKVSSWNLELAKTNSKIG